MKKYQRGRHHQEHENNENVRATALPAIFQAAKEGSFCHACSVSTSVRTHVRVLTPSESPSDTCTRACEGNQSPKSMERTLRREGGGDSCLISRCLPLLGGDRE